MDMGDYYRREPNPKKIKLEKPESAESEDSRIHQPLVQIISQNSIKLEREPRPVSGSKRRRSNETRLMNPFHPKNKVLNSKGIHTHDQNLAGFDCHKCLLHFATPGEMTRHWTERHGLYPVHCQVCNDPFPSNDDMRDHKIAIHGIPCELCDDFFKTQGMLEDHMKSVHLNDSSSVAKQVFKEEREINNSENEKMMPPMLYSLHRAFPEVQNTISSGFKCHKCPQRYQTPDLLKCHWSDRHGLRPADCSVCKEIFPSISEMLIHKTAAHGILCKLCDRHFDSEHSLIRHINACHVKCKFCGLLFNTKSSLNTHVMNSHGSEAKYCPSCSFVASSEEELDLHMASRPFSYNCSVCGMGFHTHTAFKQHKKDILHEHKMNARDLGLIPPEDSRRAEVKREDFSCDESEGGMSLTSSPTSSKSAIGLEINPSTSTEFESSTTIPVADVHNISLAIFKCNLCPAVFVAGGALRDHWFNFHEPRPLHCIFCKRIFPSHALMYEHKVAIHGINCDICNKSFLKDSALEVHMKTVHGATKVYCCSICDMRFPRVVDLEKHEVSFHPDVEGAIKRCEVCRFSCTTDNEMVIHKGKHFACFCSICGIVVSSKNVLKRHRKETGH